MDLSDFTLPGGLWADGQIYRQGRFTSVTGYLEEFVATSSLKLSSIPEWVTTVLFEAVESIGSRKWTWDDFHKLCVADRQYLMIQLGRKFGSEIIWYKAECFSCKENFEVRLEKSEWPCSQAGPGFPFTNYIVGDQELRLRLPNGADQESIENMDGEDAWWKLLYSCIDVEDKPKLSFEQAKEIEKVLEELSPQLALEMQTSCPNCQKKNMVPLDPYAFGVDSLKPLFVEVHALALAYNWTEKEILALPRKRRRMYIKLIDQTRGMVS